MYIIKYIYYNVKLVKCIVFKRLLSLMVKNYVYFAFDVISFRVVFIDFFK